MKTLLLINTVVNYGATGRITEELGETAAKKGWNIRIAYGRNERPQNSRLIKIGNFWNVFIHGLLTRLFDKHGFGSHWATTRLIGKIEKLKPDIVHLHNLHGYYINIEVLFKYLASKDIPIVWTFHDCWPFTGHCAYFDFVGCEKWRTECSKCPQKKEYPASFWLDQSQQNFYSKKELFTSINNLTIVPVSRWLGDIIRQSYFSKFPIQGISNGIDLEIFRPLQNNSIRKKYRLENKFIILGLASKWSPRKRLCDFITLSEKLESNDQIILVGLTDQQIQKLPPNIIGIRRTEKIEELVALYSSADVFINPSIEESFGMTTIEAMACGTPTIVFNATASPELIKPETGFVIDVGDIQMLINAIKTVKIKGKSSFSAVCRTHVTKLYNNSDRHLDYLNLYESILANSRK